VSAQAKAGRLNVLAIMLAPPLPATAGHRLRNLGLLRALSAEGHRVTMLSFATVEDLQSPSPGLAELCAAYELFPEPAGSQVWGRICTLFSRRPYGAVRFTSSTLRARASALIESGRFDAILLDDVYMAGNLPETHVPILLNKHDIIHRVVGQYARSRGNPFVRLYGRFEATKTRRLEREMMRVSAGVLVCSGRDRDLLAELYPATMHLVPNAIDVRSHRASGPGTGDTVLFVGAMDWLPNADGVAFFVKEILPRLRHLAPKVRFVAAGRNPPPEMLRRHGQVPGVQFTGMLEDVRPVIAAAAVCVVPLRLGSGTRLKILEAAAMGKAVVSTRLGAEGLDLRHGHELLLADDPQEFAEAVAALLRNRKLAARLGAAARTAVEKRYSIAALQEHLRRALSGLAGHAKSAPARAGGRR